MNNKQMVPIILIAYNRPGKLKIVLEALRGQTAQPPKIMAFVDAPRNDHDTPKHRAVVLLLRSYGVEVNLRDINFGCASNIMIGAMQTVKKYGRFLVLEDDVVPVSSWYETMCLLLEKYENEPRVGCVGSFPSTLKWSLQDYEYDVIMSPRFSCCGWGSWLNKFEILYEEWVQFRNGHMPWGLVPEHAGHDIPLMIKEVPRRHGWDVALAVAFLHHGLLQAIPRYYAATNIGADKAMGETLAFMLENNETADRVPVTFPPVELRVEVCRAVQEYVRVMGSPAGLRVYP